VWHQGILYQTEDQSFDSAFYRYVPRQTPGADRPLAATTGELQALKFRDVDGANTDGWPVGEPFPVEWVTIPERDPSTDTVRDQAHELEAAAFNRCEGAWLGNGKIYFDCTEGGVAGYGQIWEYNPRREVLTLIYESPGPEELKNPDNLVVGRTAPYSCARTRILLNTSEGLREMGGSSTSQGPRTTTPSLPGLRLTPEGERCSSINRVMRRRACSRRRTRYGGRGSEENSPSRPPLPLGVVTRVLVCK
jgi:Bacterial protein of unknown function (DUF839)